MVPFVLALMGAIWDLRAYTSYQATLARERFVLAEAITTQVAGTDPGGEALKAAGLRLGRIAVGGRIDAALVVRGTMRHDGSACVADAWCAPLVTKSWPGAITWSDGTASDCDIAADLPKDGDHFRADQEILPDDDGTARGAAAQPVSAWTSRQIEDNQWWVVLETCILPRPGVFFALLSALDTGMLDLSFAIRKRAAWPSAQEYPACDWCP